MRPRRTSCENSYSAILGYLPVALILIFVWTHSIAWAQEAASDSETESTLQLDTGKQIWEAGCAGCHGIDGKGQPVSTLGFEPPATFPDFTDCNGSTREATQQWSSIVHDGGKARAFVEIMPSFGPPENPALTDEQIRKVISHVRTFCTEDAKWPSGDFNFARPFFTDKSFPEDETILLTSVNTNGSGLNNELVVEKRYGAVSNFEIRLRGAFQQTPAGSWNGAIGDVSLENKRVMFLNNKAGSILSLGTELTLPTGDPRRDLGEGITKTEAFLTYGQVLPGNSFLQAEVGGEAPPFHRHQSPAEVFVRTAVGASFAQDRGFGRTWSPVMEFISTRPLGPGENWELDLVPQFQVTLSKRQHIRLNLGLNVPTVNKGTRDVQAIFYLLWDRFDGGLLEGWR